MFPDSDMRSKKRRPAVPASSLSASRSALTWPWKHGSMAVLRTNGMHSNDQMSPVQHIVSYVVLNAPVAQLGFRRGRLIRLERRFEFAAGLGRRGYLALGASACSSIGSVRWLFSRVGSAAALATNLTRLVAAAGTQHSEQQAVHPHGHDG